MGNKVTAGRTLRNGKAVYWARYDGQRVQYTEGDGLPSHVLHNRLCAKTDVHSYVPNVLEQIQKALGHE